MTKRQVKLLNEASAERKEYKKMYKSGGTWAFTTMVLISGILWAAPAVTAKAETTQKPAIAKRETDGVTSQNSVGDVSNDTTQSNVADSAIDSTQSNTADSVTTSTNAAQNVTPQASPAPETVAPKASTYNASDSVNGTTVNGTTTSPTAVVPSNKITTANLKGTNPANLNTDGSVSTEDKTNVSLSGANNISDNFKAEQIVKAGNSQNTNGKITTSDVTNTIKDGGVTLVPANQGTTAGTLVFKNQIDTSKPFTINATFKTQRINNNGTKDIFSNGGGLGFILQPVDPQKAGVGAGSDPSIDIGIEHQPNTTFIGRDGYVGMPSDTTWDQLTVRQTDANGVLSSSTPTWATDEPTETVQVAHEILFGIGGTYYTQKTQLASVPLREYVTLTWTPQTGVVNHMVSGTMTYTTYKDATRTQQFQTLTTNQASSKIQNSSQVTLNQSVSIAAFGAVGGVDPSKGESNQRTVKIENTNGQSAFTAKVNTMPIQINYLDQDGKSIQAPDITNVNVGDSISIAKTTDLSTNTFAPRVIDGYQFVKAVTSEGTNTLSIMNNVLNASTQNDELNNINIYYTNKVNYTIQPVDAQGQSIPGLAPQQMTSTIGQQVAAPTQDGYTATTDITAPKTDGNVIKVIYTANQGNLTVTYTGLPATITPAPVSVSGKVGSTYNIDTPVIAGYTADLASVQGAYVQGDTALKVQYKASNNSYLVVPVDDTGKAISALPVTTETSVTGDQVAAPTYAGYTLAENQELPITLGGVKSYQLHYTANQHQVTVSYTGLPAGLAQAQTFTGTTGEDYQISSPVVAGYTPDQSIVKGTFTPDTAANGTFKVYYTADTKVYKVQPVDENGNLIATLPTNQYDGQTGDPIEYPVYDGYTAEPNGQKVPAVSHPMPTINVKYLAKASKVTVSYAGLPTDLTPAAQTQTGVTDGTYQISAPTIAGYTPDSPILTGTYSNQGSLDKVITYTANDNSYTITPVDEDGNVIAGLSQTSGTTKTNEIIVAPDYDQQGYRKVPDQPILVTKPGVTNYKVAYSSNIQKVTVSYTGLPADQTPAAQAQTGKIGDTYSIVTPTITGYTPDSTVITGTYQNQDKNLTVNYSPITVTVTIQHTGLDSTTASTDQPQTISGKYGSQFNVTATNIAGYTTKQSVISGTFSADNGANMYAIKYTGKPATVTINYTGSDANPKSVTLTGVVGGTYSQITPVLADYTPDQTTVASMFTAANATDSKSNHPITVNYQLNKSLVTYTIVPVDINNQPITGVAGIAQTQAHAKAGTMVATPDYTDLNYIAVQKNIVVPAKNGQLVQVQYQKQVNYTMQAVDGNDHPIANLPIASATGIVGSVIAPIPVVGYNATGKTYVVPDTPTTNSNPIQIQYTPKEVAVTIQPVDGNGNQITGLKPIPLTQAGGTELTEAMLTKAGYQIKDHQAISVPISDTGIVVPLTYLREVNLSLSGSQTGTYTGSAQSVDASNYAVTLPDGSEYALQTGDIEVVPATDNGMVQNVGNYKVQLTASGKDAITAALAQNNVVSFDDTKTGSFVITPKVLTIAPANSALVPVNAANSALNPQLETSIVVQGSTKNYGDNSKTDAQSFNVLAPSAFSDFNIPDLAASDFDTSAVKQDAGNYQVTLSASGLKKLQDANANYSFDATDVQNGLYVITPAPITITAPSFTTEYTGTPLTISKGTVSAGSATQTVTPDYTIAVNGNAEDAGSYTTTVQLTPGANANYKITTVAGKIVITPSTKATITVDGGSKVYDGTTASDTSKYKVNLSDGLVAPTWSADDFDLAGINSANANSYTVTLSAAGLAHLQELNPNFALSAKNVTAGKFAITKAQAAIELSDKTQTYSGQEVTATDIPVTITGVVNGDTLNYSLTGLDANAKNVGQHVITVDPAANQNYDITTNKATLTITPEALSHDSVVVNGGTKVYNGTAASDPTQYGVTLNGALKAPTWTAADFDLSGINSQNVNDYAVSLSAQGIADLQQANPNYQVTKDAVTAGKFSITKAPITVTAPTVTKSYDGHAYTAADYQPTIDGLPVNGVTPTFALTDISGNTGVNTYTIKAAAGQHTDNYAVTYVDGTLTITPNTTAKVNVTGASKIYDGRAASYSVELSDDVKAPISWTADDFNLPTDTTNAGTYTVTLSDKGIADLQAVNPNYHFTSANINAGSFTIAKADLTVTVQNAAKVYDGTAFSTDPSSLINVTGVPKNGIAPKLSVADVSHDINAGSYEITLVVNPADNVNYNIHVNNGTLTISKKDLSITAPTVSKVYDGTTYNGDLTPTITGAIVGDTPVYTVTSVANDLNVGSYKLLVSADAAQNSNYNVSVTNGTLTITPKTITDAMAISHANKIYDNDAAKVPAFTLAGPVDAAGYPSLTTPSLTAEDFDTTAAKGQNVGSYAVTLTASGLQKIQEANANYNITANSIQSGVLTINKANVTISAPAGLTKMYDGTGYAVSDDAATVTGKPANGAAVKYHLSSLNDAVNAGTYNLNVTDTDDNLNYTVTVVSSTFTVTRNDQTAVTLGSASKAYDNDADKMPKTYTVTLPAGVSAPAQWTAADFELSSDSQNVGSYAVQLSAKGLQDLNNANKNYSFNADNVKAGSFNITPASVTVTAPTLKKTYDGKGYTVSNDEAVVTGKPAKGTDVKYHLSSLSDAINAGTYALNVLTDDNPNYTVNAVPSIFTVTKDDQATVALGTANKVYDNDAATTPKTFTVTLPTGVSAPAQWTADDFELSSNSQNVGSYAVRFSAKGLQDLNDANNNYSFGTNNIEAGSFTITPAAITVTAPTTSKTYDGTAYGDTYRPQVTGVPTKAVSPEFDLTDISHDVNAQTYTVKATLKDAANNYTITYVDGALTISKAPVTVTAPSLTKIYDGKAYAGEDNVAAVTGMPTNGHADSLNYSLTDLSQDTDVKVGGYEITVALGDNPNYAVTTQAGSLTINQVSLGAGSIAVQDQAKTYDGSAATDSTQYEVVLSNQLTAPTWTAADFDLSGITSQNVGSYTVKLSNQGLAKLQAANPNYKVLATDVTNGHQIINPAAITVTAPTLSKTYDGQAYTGNQAVLAITGVPADGDQPAFTLTDISSDKDAGTYKLTALNGQNLGNYTVNIVDGSLTITPASIQIAGPTLNKTYDGNSYTGAVTPTITGLPSKGVAPVYSMTALDNVTDAGTYTIAVNASANENSNYKISTTPGQLTISAAQAQFRFEVDAIYRIFGQKPSTDQSVYPVTIAGLTLNQPQWTPSDFVTSNTADTVGTYTVNLSEAGWQKLQAANPNYVVVPELATITPGVMTIAPISLKAADLGNIQIGSQTKNYDGESKDPTDYQVTLPSQLNVPVWNANDFQRSDSSENAGNYTVTLSETGLAALQAANPNYLIGTGDITVGQLVINKVPVTITAPSVLSKTADGKPYSGTATGVVSGKPVNGAAVVYQLDYGNDGSVGTHVINVIADSKLNPNYDITTVSKSYQILPQPVIVTPSNPVGPTVTGSAKPTDSTETAKTPTDSEAMFKEAVADAVFYYVERDGQPATSQTMTKALKQEINHAREIIESSPEHAELVVSKQDDASSKRGSHKSSRTDNAVHDDQDDRRGAQAVRRNNAQNTVSSAAQQGIADSATSSANAAYAAQTAAQDAQATAASSQQTAMQAELPQTNEQHSSWLAVLGATLMSLLGLLGFKKRKSDR